MKKILAFSRADGSEFIFDEQEAMILCHSLLNVAREKEWGTGIFLELLAVAESNGFGAQLTFDPENVRRFFNLSSSVMQHYLKHTQSTVSMLFRWQQKHPNMHIENPPNLIRDNAEYFVCVDLLCRLVGKLAIEVQHGHGITVQTKKAEEEWN